MDHMSYPGRGPEVDAEVIVEAGAAALLPTELLPCHPRKASGGQYATVWYSSFRGGLKDFLSGWSLKVC